MTSIYSSIATIDLDAYAFNLGLVRRLVGNDTGIISILKANAYGHGLLPMARVALRSGTQLLGVASVQEGIALRENGIVSPILVMLQPHRDALPYCVEHQLTLMVSDTSLADQLGALAQEANRVVPVHCKVDTGMGRQGFPLEEALNAIQYITRITRVDIQGICTHFPCADIIDDPFTLDQIKAFKQLLKKIEKLGVPYETAHAANSAAILNYRESVFDSVRPGLMTYGIWPSDAGIGSPPLKRVLRWETRIVQVRQMPVGASVGYNRSWTAYRPTRTAILPVGYADGYKHQLGNKAYVLIRGKRCPVRGAVSMDQIVVDVTDLPQIANGDTATLIGQDGNEIVTVEELARLAGVIPYDILTGIGSRVHRHYIGSAAEEE